MPVMLMFQLNAYDFIRLRVDHMPATHVWAYTMLNSDVACYHSPEAVFWASLNSDARMHVVL